MLASRRAGPCGSATDIRAAYVQPSVAVAPANPSPCEAPGHCDFGKAFLGVVKPSPEPGALLFVGDCKGTKQRVSHRQTASAGSSFVQVLLMPHSFPVFPILSLFLGSQPEGDRWSSREASKYRA